MPFLGSTPATGYISVAKQTITGNGNTAYSLDYSITNQNDLEVFVNNLRQEPGVAYNASGTTITFSEAVTSNDSIYILYQGRAVGTVNPPNGSVSASSLASGAVEAAMVTPFGMRNRIINGDMRIDQRNAGAAVTVNDQVVYSVDRYRIFETASGALSVQQDSSAPSGFVNSLKVTVTTADASLTGTEGVGVQQKIEGTNVSDLAWGTANAKTVTLSFWVRSSLTGTFGGSVRNGSVDRSYPFTYTISSADTWEQKSVTIPGDTSGTWLTTTGTGIDLTFSLGTNPDRSGTANAWADINALTPTGAVSVIGTLNATWYITGVQLEVGSVATEFERRPYGLELALCQRYYCSSFNYGQVPANNIGTSPSVIFTAYDSTNGWVTWIPFPVVMRTSPSITTYRSDAGSSDGLWATYDGGGYTSFSSNSASTTEYGFRLTGVRGSAFTQYRSYPCRGNYTASAEL